MISTETLLEHTPIENFMTAQHIANLLGSTCKEIVPMLNRLRDEGRVVRKSFGEAGHVGWRLA